MLSASAEHVKWLFGEVRRASCEFWGKWELKGTGVKALDRSYKKWDVAEAEQHLMEMAAIKGDLDLIKWLRSQDPPCEWSKKACTAAAWANRWDLLRLLLSIGCPIDKEGILGWSRVTQGTLCPTVGTESLKFSSGFQANKDAFLVTRPWIDMRSIVRLEKWSNLQVSATTFIQYSFLHTSLTSSFSGSRKQ